MQQFRYLRLLLFTGIAIGLLFQMSCKKNSGNEPPLISGLRASSPSPNDSALTVAGPGQWVVIQGQNLASATQIFFNGYPSPFNSALPSENNLLVQIPADMPFAKLNKEDLNTVKVVTTGGTAVFNFPIVPPPPVVNSITNEYAVAGTKVTITGFNFFFISKVVFPGTKEVSTGIVTNDAGTTLELTIPAGISSAGPISVMNQYGTGVSIFRFNDFVTGVLQNGDNVDNFEWGAGTVSDNTSFPGNTGKFHRMSFSNIGNGNWSWWEGTRSINLKSINWIPVADLSKPVGDFGLKFEIFVKEPWDVGTLLVRNEDSWKYILRYSPWKQGTNTVPFSTPGWQTVTIPLTEFRTKANGVDGSGDSAPTLTELLGATGTRAMGFMFVNDGSKMMPVFDAAIDNIRVVRIK